MRALLKLLLCVLVAASAGCGDYKEVTRETGYKGKARMNPWLAAERFAEGKGHTVVSATSWKDPEWTDAVYFVPVEVLNNAGFISKFGPWISNGGHQHAEQEFEQRPHAIPLSRNGQDSHKARTSVSEGVRPA